MSPHSSSARTLDNLRKDAKRWLRSLRAGDESARLRLHRVYPSAPAETTLRDVQHALARERGFDGWGSLKRAMASADAKDEPGLIKIAAFESDRPYGPWFSRGIDVWDAICAAREGDVNELRRLVSRDPNLPKYSEPLRFAVREGHIDAVQCLLDAGADSDGSGGEGESLIVVARDRGHEAVAALLENARSRRVPAYADGERIVDHPIHAAAGANQAGLVRRMLDDEPDLLNRSDRKGATPLHRAAAWGAKDVIRLLVERGADVHAVHGRGPADDEGYAPVDHQAIDLALFWRRRGDFETARLLIELGAVGDLTIAAAFGEADLIAAALDEDPSRIREARAWGKRPLSAAVDFERNAVVRLLLQRGADPNWPEGVDAPRGFALHTAAGDGNRPMVELLLDHGADPNAHVDSSGNATWAAKTSDLRALLLSRGGSLDCYDLVWLHEDDEVVRRVRADPSAANVGCGSVFAAAATLGKRDLVAKLLQAGARVPAVVTDCRSYLLEDPDILRLLLAGGMNPDLPNWQRATPLHDLCGRDGRGRERPHRLECAGILLDAGANIIARDEEYRSTPLAWAARNNLPDMVQFLLARGAPVMLSDDEPWATPLAWAARRGHVDVLRVLKGAAGC